jgi:chemotaxis protein MotA
MPEPVTPKETTTPAPSSQARLRPDFATLGGIGLALAGILGGLILERGSILDIAQGTAFLIVIGGTLGAVLVTTPMAVVVRAFQGLGGVFLERTGATSAVIEVLIHFATKARKNGIVSLETEAGEIADPFLRKALNLAVDGTDLQELRKMMETDISLGEHVAEAEAKVWESAGGYAPTIGIIGAVLGLIQVMKHLEDIKEVGHGIAVAFVATVYGVGSANIFFLPAANKLRARMRDGTLNKEMILEGVIGIVEGLNPTLIRQKLEAYNQSPRKIQKPKKPGAPQTAQTPAPKAAPNAAAQNATGRPQPAPVQT